MYYYFRGNNPFHKSLKYSFILFLGLFVMSSCNKEDDYFLPDHGEICFRTINGNFVSDNRNQNNVLLLNGVAPNEWETFKLEKQKSGNYAIKTSFNKYVSYNNPDSIFMGNAKNIGETELFFLIPHNEYFELQTIDGRNVVVNEKLQLKIAYNKSPLIVEINNTSDLLPPKSWFSLMYLNLWPFIIQLSVLLTSIYIFFRIFKNLIKQNRLSYCTVIVLGFILLYVIFNMKLWKTTKLIYNDVISYYEYLPAAFIFNDLSFNFINNPPEDFNGDIWVTEIGETGNKVPKTSMGVSFMYLPFFLMGHLTAHIQGYTTYGYSEPYGRFLCIGAWLYVFLALFYLRKILLLYFNDTVTSFTLFSVVLATNLFHYVTAEGGMSHSYSFFLFTMFMWHTIKWYKDKKWITAIFLGLIFGLITLIRPTNGLLAIIFLLYGVINIKSLKYNLNTLWSYKIHLLIIFIFTLLVWLPQIAFWKYATDGWFYFSYGEERFYFDNPHIIDGLFSYRKGWLLYTPLMTFALIGIFFLFKRQKQWAFPILIFTAFNIYVIFSWWCWWYGGGFGSRPMVDSYGLLAIPLAAFFAYFDEKKNYFRSAPLFIIFLTTSLNLFQTQQKKTCLHWDSMTQESYWANFTTLGYYEGMDNLLKHPDYEKVLKTGEE